MAAFSKPDTQALVRSHDGFTLVEIMVVVTLVGILSSIAVSNYNKFTARARQTEGKVALSAIYTSLKSFSVEKGSYTGCLRQAGYQPESGSKRYYTIGIGGNAAFTNTCGPGGNSWCYIYEFTGGIPCTASNVNFGDNVTLSDIAYAANAITNSSVGVGSLHSSHLTGATVSQGTFKVTAIGSISSSSTIDTWTINDQRLLSNDVSGI